MNVVFINHFATPPEYGVPNRTFYMAKELAKQGHNVTVVAAANTHKRTSKIEQKFDIFSEYIEDVQFLFLPNVSLGIGRISRALSMFIFVISLMIFRRKVQEIAKPNVIIEATTYILPIFSSAWIARKSHAKLIYEVRDLWPASPIEISGKSKYHPLFLFIAIAQKYALKNADAVVSTLRYADEYFTQNVCPPKSFFHIQNGIDGDYYNQTTETKGKTFYKIKQIKDAFKGCVGYTGSFGDANGIQTLLGAAYELEKIDVAIVLVGRGTRKGEFEKFAKMHNLSNIYIFDAVPKDEIVAITKLFDIGYSGGVKRQVHHYGISPNKVFDYMMSAIPMLLCYDTKDNFLEDIGCSIVVREPSAEFVFREIINFFNLEYEQRLAMGRKGRDAAMKLYEYSILARSYSDVFKYLTDKTA